MEFLYSLNRLNVAISRAKAMSILVANLTFADPAVFRDSAGTKLFACNVTVAKTAE